MSVNSRRSFSDRVIPPIGIMLLFVFALGVGLVIPLFVIQSGQALTVLGGLAAICLGLLVITFPRVGVILLLVEVVLGGSGRWIALPGGLSPRIILFLLVMISWLLNKLILTGLVFSKRSSVLQILVLAIGFPLLWGGLGLLHGNSLGYLLEEANGPLFFLVYFPMLEACLKAKHRSLLVFWFMFSILTLSLLTILFFLLGTLGVYNVGSLLTRLDLGRAGAQPLGYRVYFKAINFVPIGLTLLSSEISAKGRKTRWNRWLLLLIMAAALIFSQTRGAWIAFLLGVVFVFLRSSLRAKLRTLLMAVIIVILLILVGEALGFSVVNLVSQKIAGIVLGQDVGDYSVENRYIQFGALWSAFLQRPLLGHGYGAALHVTKYNPRGQLLNTERNLFELNYIAMLFKHGGVGTLLWFVLMGRIFYRGMVTYRKIPSESSRILLNGFLGGLLGLLSITATNPYVGGALGISYTAFTMALVDGIMISQIGRDNGSGWSVF